MLETVRDRRNYCGSLVGARWNRVSFWGGSPIYSHRFDLERRHSAW